MKLLFHSISTKIESENANCREWLIGNALIWPIHIHIYYTLCMHTIYVCTITFSLFDLHVPDCIMLDIFWKFVTLPSCAACDSCWFGHTVAEIVLLAEQGNLSGKLGTCPCKRNGLHSTWRKWVRNVESFSTSTIQGGVEKNVKNCYRKSFRPFIINVWLIYFEPLRNWSAAAPTADACRCSFRLGGTGGGEERGRVVGVLSKSNVHGALAT